MSLKNLENNHAVLASSPYLLGIQHTLTDISDQKDYLWILDPDQLSEVGTETYERQLKKTKQVQYAQETTFTSPGWNTQIERDKLKVTSVQTRDLSGKPVSSFVKLVFGGKFVFHNGGMDHEEKIFENPMHIEQFSTRMGFWMDTTGLPWLVPPVISHDVTMGSQPSPEPLTALVAARNRIFAFFMVIVGGMGTVVAEGSSNNVVLDPHSEVLSVLASGDTKLLAAYKRAWGLS